MSILCIDLSEGVFTTLDSKKERGLELAIKLYKEFDGKAFIITAPTEMSVKFPGSTNFIVAFHSPLSDKMEFQHSNLPPGFSLYKMGYEALVIKGRASYLSYISLYSGNNEIFLCEHLRGQSSARFESIAGKSINDTFISTGRAADNGVRFASVLCSGRAIAGAGIGYVFSSMNLKGIVFQGFFRKDELSNDKSVLKYTRKIDKSNFAHRIRKNGANCFIDDGLRLGWLAVFNYQRRFDPRAYSLNGESFSQVYGNFPDSCQDCFIACGRRKKDNSILPTWQECISLGTNIGFFDPRTVSSFVQAAYEEGLDCTHLGAIFAYISSLGSSNLEVLSIEEGKPEEYLKLIHSIGESRGVGAIFRDGLKGLPDAIQSVHHGAIAFDLRGSFSQSIIYSLGLDMPLYATLLLPKRQMGAETSAILAFYELAYDLALFCYGFGPVLTTCIYWDKIPRFVFSSPFWLRLFARHFSIYGLKGKDLLQIGIRMMDEMELSFEHIPEIFEMNPESAKDNSTVPLIRLQNLFLSEKERVERTLKSNKDTISKPKGKSKAAVGPDEDLGREGDPGFNR